MATGEGRLAFRIGWLHSNPPSYIYGIILCFYCDRNFNPLYHIFF
jgi:hypothetical protein